MKTLTDHRYIVIFLILTMLSVPFMGRGLFESSEGRYARVAQTMVKTNDFRMPKLNGIPHLTKPPLTYWVIAAGIDIGGDNTYSARLFHTIAWLITGLIIVRIGSELVSPSTGFLAGLIFSTGLFPSLGSWSLTTDPLLVFFEAFFLLALIRYEKEKTTLSAFVFWTMVGLAFLTKGPIALLPFPFLIIKWRKTLWELVKTNLWPLAILIGFGWYIALEIQTPGILLKLIRDELILRSTTDVSGRNPSWWSPLFVYYIPFLVGWGVWPFLIEKKKLFDSFKTESRTWQMAMIFWIIVSLIFFSFVQSRLTLYILPLAIPMSLLLGDLIQNSKHTLKVALINCAMIIALKGYGTYIYHSPDNSLQLSSFAKPFIKKDSVHLLWEKSLFGFEYYLPAQFKKNINPFQSFDSLQKPTWVLYQEKRKDLFKQFLAEKNLQIKETHSFFKWELTEVHLSKKINSPQQAFTSNRK